MADIELQCRDCSAPFTFTDGEQEFYASKNLSNPSRCKSCRATRKANGGANGGKPQMHDAVCSTCGVACQVPFQPVEGRAVFCRPCFANNQQ